MARFPQSEYSKIFERYIKGESLFDIHKDYSDILELSSLQLYASRHGWKKFKNSVKLELEKAQVYRDEKQSYTDTIIATMNHMAEAKQQRIELSKNLLKMLGSFVETDTRLAPRELATIASALSVVCDIQRTEFGEASIITQNLHFNANYSAEEKKKELGELRRRLAEYESQQDIKVTI